MASISREPNGRRTSQFIAADGKRIHVVNAVPAATWMIWRSLPALPTLTA